MWNSIKKWFVWTKYRLRHGFWWTAKEQVRKVYHEAKGEKSYMIEVYGGKAIYENKENMENLIYNCEKSTEIPKYTKKQAGSEYNPSKDWTSRV